MESDSASEDEFGEHWIDPGDLFVNVADSSSGKYENQVATAINHFNKFLARLHQHHPRKFTHTAIDKIPPKEFEYYREIFGQFADYLRKIQKVGYGSCLGYVSKVKTHICNICEKNRLSCDLATGNWFTKLNEKIKKAYVIQISEKGGSLRQGAPPMSSDDLAYLCNVLSRRNTRESFSHRCILLIQWQALGRISEVVGMKYSDIEWNSRSRCLTITMNRTKVGVMNDINVFLHCKSRRLCPLYALGEFLFIFILILLLIYRIIFQAVCWLWKVAPIVSFPKHPSSKQVVI